MTKLDVKPPWRIYLQEGKRGNGMSRQQNTLYLHPESGSDTNSGAEDSPLRTLPNCVLTPHIAGGLARNCHRQGKLTAEEVEAFTAGQPLQNELDLTRLHCRA